MVWRGASEESGCDPAAEESYLNPFASSREFPLMPGSSAEICCLCSVMTLLEKFAELMMIAYNLEKDEATRRASLNNYGGPNAPHRRRPGAVLLRVAGGGAQRAPEEWTAGDERARPPQVRERGPAEADLKRRPYYSGRAHRAAARCCDFARIRHQGRLHQRALRGEPAPQGGRPAGRGCNGQVLPWVIELAYH